MPANRSSSTRRSPVGLSGLAEQLVNRILKPMGLIVLSGERIQETLEEAAERGRVTRSDANELAALLIQRGRQQTDELMSDLDHVLGRGRQRLDKSVDRLVRGADQARRKVGVGPSFPILGYDDLTVVQIRQRLGKLDRPELRKVRDYERRYANRKTVLKQIEKQLG